MPNNTEKVLEYLKIIAPNKATNSEIVKATNIQPHQQVFQITSNLLETNQICGIKNNGEWELWINEAGMGLTREHVIQALNKIDERGVKSDERSSTYDLIYDAKRYPPKLVYSLAHKYRDGKIFDRSEFNGGNDTQCFNDLRRLNFIIERKDFVLELLNKFISQADKGDNLTTSEYPNEFQTLKVVVSFGKGNIARVPWISFVGYDQKTKHGIYPVYLYYKSIGILVLCYGVSEETKPGIYWNNLNKKEKIKDYLLREYDHVPERYGESYVHSVYKVPLEITNDQLTADLDKLIQQYITLMEANGDEDERVSEKELCLIGTAKSFHEKIGEVNRIIHEKGGWATCWSFVIDEKAQDALSVPFYLYLNAGAGRVKYRFFITEYVTKKGGEGVESPWPDITHENERGINKLGDAQNLIFKTWFKVERIDKFNPPISTNVFLPYEPFSNERNLINQNAFGYAYLKEPVNPVISVELPPKQIREPILEPKSISNTFSIALKKSQVSFGENHDGRVNAFVASLMTKPLVILTGLSGSGKTQIALRFGEWLGKGRMLVAPVRPDWTGAEALFGYEDALKPGNNGNAAWAVPDTLKFLLKAASDPYYPYLLVLDEMNLAHVERYFADVLSGMESGQACLPNLVMGSDGFWRIPPGGDEKIPFPKNVFIVGTVNVDETTYMFSPKVLDRANTFEFRVTTEDLSNSYIKPVECAPGDEGLVRGFLEIGQDDGWHLDNPFSASTKLSEKMRQIHGILSKFGFEFGHRVFYESQRFAAIYGATGDVVTENVLDLIIMQKLLPRLHGSRRRLEDVIRSFAEFCFNGAIVDQPENPLSTFEPDKHDANEASLPISFDKLNRMLRSLRANQFTSFTE